jgi:hypothetical protein
VHHRFKSKKSPKQRKSKMATSSFPVKVLNKSGTEELLPTTIQLSTIDGGVTEIILDYGRAVGGIPFFETANVESEDGAATLGITYSETRAGIDKEKGMRGALSDPEFLANSPQAMDHSYYFQTQWTHTE